MTLAMLDYPYPCNFVTPMPGNPVNYSCSKMANVIAEGHNSTASLLAGLEAVQNVFLNYTGSMRCHNVSKEYVRSAGQTAGRHPAVAALANLRSAGASGKPSLGDISRPWNYQACTELILELLTSDGFGFMVEDDVQIPGVEDSCRLQFGDRILDRRLWMLRSFGNGAQICAAVTNTIFSDGEKDPWRTGGVSENCSAYSIDNSTLHITIEGAAHHQDLRTSDPRNAPTVDAAKELEKAYIKKWLGL